MVVMKVATEKGLAWACSEAECLSAHVRELRWPSHELALCRGHCSALCVAREERHDGRTSITAKIRQRV